MAAGSTTINMTPMIDVVFLLIIFFLVSSHLADQEQHVELELPTAASGLSDLAERETLVINVMPTGEWRLAGAVVGTAEISQAMRRRTMAAAQPIQLRIRTDGGVPYERHEPLLKLAAEAGIGDIVFSVFEAPKK